MGMIERILTLFLCFALIVAIPTSGFCEEAEIEETQTAESEPTESQEGQEAEEESYLYLPANTPIRLVMQERLYSQRNREGDEIIFTVAEDIVVMNQTYICEGTPVIGRVIGAKAAKSWGRQGTLDIEIRTIAAPYGMPIMLTSELQSEGGSKKAGSIVTTAILGVTVVGLLAGGSISGSGAVIEAGTTITVFTAEEGKILDIPGDEMQAMVDDWMTNRVMQSFLEYRWDKRKNIQKAIESLGYSIDDITIEVEPLEDFHWGVAVHLTPTQTAEFTLQPFEEPHIGKFITLEAQNDFAEDIMKATK